jgi:hypothetical protein
MCVVLAGTAFAQAAPKAEAGAAPAAQTKTPAAAAEPEMNAQGQPKIGASAVWQLPKDFVAQSRAACEKDSNSPNDGTCFIDRMSAAGASNEAVDFARMMYYQTDNEVMIVTDIHKSGPVDVVKVSYPLRTANTVGMLIVNGDPPVLDVDDLKLLDSSAMNDNPNFKAVQSKFPYTMMVKGDRASTFWPQVITETNGNSGLIFGYPLLNGCHSCPHVGLARFSWNFDRKGKFLNATYVPTPPPPFKERQVQAIEAESKLKREQEEKQGISQTPISVPPEAPDATTPETPSTTATPPTAPPPQL